MYGRPRSEVGDGPAFWTYHSVMSTTPPTPTTADPVVQVRLSTGPLVAAPGSGHLENDGSRGGGICTFEGITRPEDHPEHGRLLCLRYEAAEPLASRRLGTLAAEIARRHGLHRIDVEHAIGEVAVGRASVRIVTIADHRDAAFAACRETIDRLKEEIPIWKQECWETGSTWSDATSTLPEAITSESNP